VDKVGQMALMFGIGRTDYNYVPDPDFGVVSHYCYHAKPEQQNNFILKCQMSRVNIV